MKTRGTKRFKNHNKKTGGSLRARARLFCAASWPSVPERYQGEGYDARSWALRKGFLVLALLIGVALAGCGGDPKPKRYRARHTGATAPAILENDLLASSVRKALRRFYRHAWNLPGQQPADM